MRSTARVLSVAALASATLGFAASAALADPAAEVSPSTVSPGGSVTVSVSCEPTGGQAPASIDANSEAFDEGTVQLQRVPGNDEGAAGPAYRGTARVSSADDSTDDSAADNPAADNPAGSSADHSAAGFAADAPEEAGRDSAWTVDGTCPPAPGGKGKAWRATFQANHGGDGGGGVVGGGVGGVVGGGVGGGDESRPCDGPGADSCAGAPIEHGVQAGAGGTFTDSVPALVMGGILIAGALGGAAYRLWHRGSAFGR